MDKKIVKLIMDQVATSKLDKKSAVEILKSLKEKDDKAGSEDIAIIGMDVKMPKADNVDEYWNNIRDNRDCVDSFPENRVEEVSAYVNYILQDNEQVKFYKAAYINNVSKFDYNFWGISPKEACLLDPGQRLLLETAYHAVEDAGYDIDELQGDNTGVFIGLRTDTSISYEKICNDYNKANNQENMFVGNIKAIMAGRISYMFDFKGPCMVIDTACSASLVALHTACQSIRTHECEQAIVGTVRILLLPFETDAKIGIESIDNKTRSFDNSANGTVWGEGVISLLVKRLDLAERDHDNIYAVIKGSAINQDGKTMAISTPNAEAQMAVILEAWKRAKIDPECIKYIEAHGTGTVLGDPIELESMTRAFKQYTNKKQFCAIGSVKTNIGHLDNAAGLASVVRVIKAMEHRVIPSSNNFERPNSKISFENSPVYFADNTSTLGEDETYIAAINSFGMSGTNCHMIFQDYHRKIDSSQSMIKPYILTISAKSNGALERLIKLYYNYIKEKEEDEVRDVCYTSNVCRKHYNYRLAISADSKEELLQYINDSLKEKYIDKKVFFGFFRIASKSKQEITEGYRSVSDLLELSNQANDIIYKLEKATVEDDEIVQLCRLYVKGANVKWNRLYIQGRKKKIPVYPFDKTVCWVNSEKIYFNQHTQNMLYNLQWVEERKSSSTATIEDENVLLIGNTRKSLNNMMNWYLEREINVYMILLKVEEDGDKECFYSDGTEDSFIKVLSKFVNCEHLQITYVSEKQDSFSKDTLNISVFVYVALVKALVKKFARKNISLNVLTQNAFSVTGQEDNLSCTNSMLIGVTKALAYETRKIRSKCIDFDERTSIDNILEEFNYNKEKFLCAFRNNKRYIQQLNGGLEVDSKVTSDVSIKDNGVYIITGGTGGVGLEVAKWLTKNHKVNIMLLSRHNIMENDGDPADAINDKVCKISALRRESKTLEWIACDIADKENMVTVLRDIRNRHGTIDGVFHCAGISGDGFLFKKTKEKFNNVIKPKVLGTYLIDMLTREDNMDFLVLFSSCLSITGAPGQSDYTAANSFLDSYVSYRKKAGYHTVGINWTAWKETGMAVRNDYTEDGIFRSIKTDDAIFCLDRIMKSGCDSAIVAEIDYENEGFKQLSAHLNLGKDVGVAMVNSPYNASFEKNDKKKIKVALTGDIDNRYTEDEMLVGEIWAEVLGIYKFNVYDSFFDLGGHSLIVIQMLELFEQKGIVLEESHIYNNITIRSLAKIIQ